MPTRKPPSKVHPLDEVKQMINRLEDKVEKRLDKVDDKIDHIAESTVRNTTSLEEHIRGVRALEKRNDMLKSDIDNQRDELLRMSTAVLAAVSVPTNNKNGLWHHVKHFFKFLHELKWTLMILASTGAGAAFLHWFVKLF